MIWDPSWGTPEAKLAPKSEKMVYQDDVKKSSKIWSRSGTRDGRSGRGVLAPKESLRDPLKLVLEYKRTRGQSNALVTLPLGTRPEVGYVHVTPLPD